MDHAWFTVLKIPVIWTKLLYSCATCCKYTIQKESTKRETKYTSSLCLSTPLYRKSCTQSSGGHMSRQWLRKEKQLVFPTRQYLQPKNIQQQLVNTRKFKLAANNTTTSSPLAQLPDTHTIWKSFGTPLLSLNEIGASAHWQRGVNG